MSTLDFPFRRRYLSTVCREGWLFLGVMAFVFLAALLREINLLMALFGLMGGLFLFNWRSVLVSLRGLRVRRKLPERVCAGDLLLVEVELENPRPRGTSWALVVDDTIRRRGGAADRPLEVSLLCNRLKPGDRRRLTYEGRITQRGRYQVGPARLSTSYPVGLMKSLRWLPESDELLVYPRLGRLTRRWQQLFPEGAHGSRRVDRRLGSAEGEFHNLRQWHEGDSQRWVHWRTTARRGEVMVRQFERHGTQDLLLLVDLWQPEEPDRAARENVELAVSLAATLIADVCRRGTAELVVGLAGASPDVTSGAGSTARMHDLLERLAVAEAGSDDSLPTVLGEALAAAGVSSKAVLVSTRECSWGDAARFGSLADDARFHALAAKCACIDVARADLPDYFTVE